jgi:hypothetical protein
MLKPAHVIGGILRDRSSNKLVELVHESKTGAATMKKFGWDNWGQRSL